MLWGWPAPAGRANTLNGDGRLSLDPPGNGEPADRYAYDPIDPVPTIGGNNSVLTMTQGAQTPILPGPRDQRVLERRDDVLCYTSDVLDRDLEVVGPIEMVLYAASSAKDTDFIVRLSDVYPNGKAIFLAEGMLRARYRGSVAGESVELLEPDEVAFAVAFLAAPEAGAINGQTLILDGGGIQA